MIDFAISSEFDRFLVGFSRNRSSGLILDIWLMVGCSRSLYERFGILFVIVGSVLARYRSLAGVGRLSAGICDEEGDNYQN